MPTLPPAPADVARVQLIFDVGGREWSTSFHLFGPTLPSGDVFYLEELAAAVIDFDLQMVLNCLHSGCSFRTCRISAGQLTVERSFDFAAGIWSGGQAQGITVGWHWLTGEGRRSSAALTHLAAVPDAWIEDNVRLSNIGYANLQDKGTDLLEALQDHPAPSGGPLVPVVLHRRDRVARANGPYVTPIRGVAPMRCASTMGRRMQKTRGAPPLP